MGHLESARCPMAENGGARSLIDHFAVLADPRQSWKVVYPLPEVLLLVLCGPLAGAEDFVEIRRWGMVNQGFLRRFLPFAEGIPRPCCTDQRCGRNDPGPRSGLM